MVCSKGHDECFHECLSSELFNCDAPIENVGSSVMDTSSDFTSIAASTEVIMLRHRHTALPRILLGDFTLSSFEAEFLSKMQEAITYAHASQEFPDYRKIPSLQSSKHGLPRFFVKLVRVGTVVMFFPGTIF